MSTKYAKRRILQPSEVEGFERMIGAEKIEKTETEEFYVGSQVKPGDSDQIKRVKKTLAAGQPELADKKDWPRLEGIAKTMKEWLQKRMVPRTHIGLRSSNNGSSNYEFIKAAGWMASPEGELSAEFTRKANEYKNIMRLLGREDETNIENIRPDTI